MAFSCRYKIHKLLKDGVFGPILQCQDTVHDDQMVAVKLVSYLGPQSMTDHRLQETRAETTGLSHENHHSVNTVEDQAAHERRIIEILHSAGGHPNVLRFHHIYKKASIELIVMEYCSGGDLQELMVRQPCRRFEESQALQLFKQIVAGVHFLHAHGIAHRDLSLENVLLTERKACKICDFGLSVHSTSMTNEIVGKRFYMAPEMVSGEMYDPQLADLWSLGIMLFIMITGLPLIDFCASKPQEEVNEMILEIVKMHGVSRMLELWGLEWMVSRQTMALLDGILRVDPFERIRPETILQILGGSKETQQ